MKPEQGVLPILRAAADQEVAGGDYYGPGGWHEMRGYPVKVGTASRATRVADATSLWAISENLTDVRYDALSASR